MQIVHGASVYNLLQERKVVRATSSIQTEEQITAILDEEFVEDKKE